MAINPHSEAILLSRRGCPRRRDQNRAHARRRSWLHAAKKNALRPPASCPLPLNKDLEYIGKPIER
jgi:hypothetical protein